MRRALALLLLVPVACSEPAPPAPHEDKPTTTAGPDHPVEQLRADLGPQFALIREGRSDVARVRLRKIVDADPHDGHAAFLFGLTYHVEKRYALALEWFDIAVREAPNLAVAAYFRGWALYYQGRLPEARAAFERHEGMDPDEHDTQFALGLIAFDDGRLDDAERRLDAALGLVGDDPARIRDRSKILARRSEVFAARGDNARALTDLEAACALYPDHYEAQFMLARLRRKLGDEEGAAAAEQAGREARARAGG